MRGPRGASGADLQAEVGPRGALGPRGAPDRPAASGFRRASGRPAVVPPFATALLAALILFATPTAFPSAALAAQEGEEVPWWRVDGGFVVGGTGLDPAPGGGSARELRVEQPILSLHAGTLAGAFRARFHGMLNLEGLTMPGGVLTMGAFGEGFVDRRHPHTYLHEAMVSLALSEGRLGAADVSVAAGRGMVAFGTDDPMNRPALRYPVNHHWAQIMERAVVTLGARRGPLVVEGSLFNGDEPASPGQWPRLDRFGDSWSARILLHPVAGMELQASHASVASPEHRSGAGPDAVKWSASARFERESTFAMIEWARTSEAEGSFAFSSVLGEVARRRGAHRVFYRFERTERPEEERTTDPFRAQRPHLDDSILGVSRWTIHTLGWRGAARHRAGVTFEPLAEVSLGRVASAGPGIFDAAAFYGRRTAWGVTAGIRIATGRAHRMGRYGVLAPDNGGRGHDQAHAQP